MRLVRIDELGERQADHVGAVYPLVADQRRAEDAVTEDDRRRRVGMTAVTGRMKAYMKLLF